MATDPKQLLAEMRTRCEAATKGPWSWDDKVGAVFDSFGDCAADQTTISDGIHIAHARTDLPRTIRALQAALKHRADFRNKGGEYEAACRNIETLIADALEEKVEKGGG